MGKPQKESMVDECDMDAGDTNAMQNSPSEEPEEELARAHQDIAGYGDPDNEEKEYPPGPQDDDDLGEVPERPLESVVKENEYKMFFKRMMDKEGIKSIGDLSDEKKKAFFNKVDKLWKAKNENTIIETEYHTFFKRMMDMNGIASISQLKPEKKKSFFKKVSSAWKKEKGESVAESVRKNKIKLFKWQQ